MSKRLPASNIEFRTLDHRGKCWYLESDRTARIASAQTDRQRLLPEGACKRCLSTKRDHRFHKPLSCRKPGTGLECKTDRIDLRLLSSTCLMYRADSLFRPECRCKPCRCMSRCCLPHKPLQERKQPGSFRQAVWP